MPTYRRIAIIPARGGSKRLPRKNIIDFFGKPIIAYTVEAALETRLFDRVFISSEDAEIIKIGARYGAEISQRPSTLATDSATVVQVCLDLLAQEQTQGRSYDVICCLYATAPLRRAEDIAATVNLIVPGKCDFALALTGYTHYAHQALKLNDSGFFEPMWPEYTFSRGEQVGELFAGNGSTYAASVGSFQSHKRFYGPKMKGYLMPFMRSVDIDNQEDFEMACCFAQHLGLKG